MLVGKCRVQRCILRKRHLSRGTRIVSTRTTSSKGESCQMVSVAVKALVMSKWAGFLELCKTPQCIVDVVQTPCVRTFLVIEPVRSFLRELYALSSLVLRVMKKTCERVHLTRIGSFDPSRYGQPHPKGVGGTELWSRPRQYVTSASAF